MFLAVTEMRRAWGRFVLLAGSVALLVFLILFQQALQDALVTAFVGAVRNQDAPVIVYSVDAQRTLQASQLDPKQIEGIRGVRGVGSTARVVQGTSTIRVGSGDLTDAAVIGTDDGSLFVPVELSGGRRPSVPGEAVGSDVDFDVGDRVEVVPAPGGEATALRVVGVAPEIQLNVTPTLFTDAATAAAARRAVNPAAPADLTNALAVEPERGTEPSTVTRRIEDEVSDVEALTREDAATRAPGVDQVQQSFQVIFLLYALVVPLVTGLFFLILTLQKSRSLTLLRAVGARPAVLVRSLLAQVVLVLVAGIVVGVALFLPVSSLRVGSLPLRFDGTVVVVWASALIVLGLVSALVSMRRVLRIDPIEATTGGGGR
jgi:putative ABC transport system permease protein